jgi:predicted ester cyclase
MWVVDCEGTKLESSYRRYLQRCNEHGFAELEEFVADDVEVNGTVRGLSGYADGLSAVAEAYPDFHWDLRHLLVDGCWLSAHLLDTGTTPDGRPVRTQEFAIYRVDRGRIAEVWGDLDHTRLS